ncbi:hypothetical protein AM493_03640 [Flavobacterium akiainvivens]|uniref:Uncharacterized protein n=1 Tax=Flavobacterium akiainvivens TaxID=1202724 RepID=A0A0M9VH59_9FLAO|nr:hypothetical protein [Flavobacterium akiainvivens]KOS05229.1 hypothetical protein AM493_03640 [Flavobacterium akiainvivens]SFQ50416.1 hypothetical protein SAMN05444144_10675 [Flavobacterium akiainvivens]
MTVNNSQHSGAENDIVIDVNNNEDVTRFVDHFFEDHGLSSKSSRIRIEKLLKFIPHNITSQKDITTWIRKNWDKKFYGM